MHDVLCLVNRTSLANKLPWANSQQPNVSVGRTFRLALAVFFDKRVCYLGQC